MSHLQDISECGSRGTTVPVPHGCGRGRQGMGAALPPRLPRSQAAPGRDLEAQGPPDPLTCKCHLHAIPPCTLCPGPGLSYKVRSEPHLCELLASHVLGVPRPAVHVGTRKLTRTEQRAGTSGRHQQEAPSSRPGLPGIYLRPPSDAGN